MIKYDDAQKELIEAGLEVGGSEVSFQGQFQGYLLFQHGGEGLINEVAADPGSKLEELTRRWDVRHVTVNEYKKSVVPW